MKTLFKEYSSYHDEYTKLYGDSTVVLMQHGSFYEIMAKNYDDLNTIANITGLKRGTRCAKSKLYCIIGFPTIQIHKYVNLLVLDKFNVVVIGYIPNTKDRCVTNIHLFSTDNFKFSSINTFNNGDANNVTQESDDETFEIPDECLCIQI